MSLTWNHVYVQVVVTDYPEDELIVNINENIENNTTANERENVVNVQGHLWGSSMEPLLAALSESGDTKFDVIIMADLIANHSQQNKLLQAAREALSDEGVVRSTPPDQLHDVEFTSYRARVSCVVCRVCRVCFPCVPPGVGFVLVASTDGGPP
jgi:nicotinamide N-methyltransferase